MNIIKVHEDANLTAPDIRNFTIGRGKDTAFTESGIPLRITEKENKKYCQQAKPKSGVEEYLASGKQAQKESISAQQRHIHH